MRWLSHRSLRGGQACLMACGILVSMNQAHAADETRFVTVCMADDANACSNVVAAKRVEGGWAVPAEVGSELGVLHAPVATGDAAGLILIPDAQAGWSPDGLVLSWSAPIQWRNVQTLTRPTNGRLPDRMRQGASARVDYTLGVDSQGHGSAGANLMAGRNNTWLQASAFAYGGHIQRGLVFVEHLRPEQAQQWSVGEVLAAAADPLGGAGLVRGIAWRRDFSLQPDRSTLPTPHMTGVFEEPGVVEVYRNGVLVERTPVSPGPYEWGQLPVGTGANDLEVVFRGAGGERQTLDSTLFLGQAGTLAPGLVDFSIVAGQDPLGQTAWQGWIRRGLPHATTVGVRAEGTGEQSNVGAFAQVALGPLAASAAVARDNQQRKASSLQLDFQRGGFAAQAFAWHADIDYWRMGRDSRTQLFVGAVERQAVGAAASLTRGQVSHTVQWSARRLEDGLEQSTLLASSTWSTPGHWRWTVSAKAQSGQRSDRMIALAVAIPMGPQSSLSTMAEAGSNAGLTTQYTRTHEGAWGSSLAASSRVDAHGATLGGRLVQDRPIGTARVEATQSPNGLFAQANFSGSIAVADGQVRLGSARQGGAVLVKVKGVPEARISVNHHEAGQAGTAGLLVDGLAANTPVDISIEPESLPLDADLARAATCFLSSGRGVAVIELDPLTAPHLTAQVWIQTAEGTAVPAARGLLVIDGERYLVGTAGQAWLPVGIPVDKTAILEGHEAPMQCRQTQPDRWDCRGGEAPDP